MRKSKRYYYQSPFGVWLTDRDIKNHTPPDERRGYRLTTFVLGALGLLFGILAIARVPAVIAGAWVVLALLCFALLFVYLPLGWSRYLAAQEPDIDIHTQLNPSRVDNFWYERGVSDTPHEPDNTMPPVGEQAPAAPPPDLRNEADSRRE